MIQAQYDTSSVITTTFTTRIRVLFEGQPIYCPTSEGKTLLPCQLGVESPVGKYYGALGTKWSCWASATPRRQLS